VPVYANLFGNVIGAITGNNVAASPPAAALLTHHQANMQALKRAAQQAGYTPHAGSSTAVMIGDPGNVDMKLVDGGVIPVARKFGVSILRLSDSGFQNVQYTQNGQDYKGGGIVSAIVPCNSNLSVCDFSASFYPALQANPLYIGTYVVRNVIWDTKLDQQSVLSGLSMVHQPGLTGPNKIYIFFDPDCSVCWHEFHVIQNGLPFIKRNYPNVSIEWVPTDMFRGNKSAGRAEQAVEGGFPAIADDFDHFDMQTETGGLSGAPVQSYQNEIAYNVATAYYFALKYGVAGQAVTRANVSLGTPTVVAFVNGTPVILNGFPSKFNRFFSAVNASQS
jgi:hypothetical protein